MPAAAPHSRAASPGRPGLVVATHRRHYLVDVGDAGPLECQLKGRTLTLACGDRVQIEPVGPRGIVVGIAPRSSLLYRSDAWREKIVAANVTQVIALVAPDVPVDEHLLNRWIVAAEAERCRFVLAVNKTDLAGSARFLERFAPYRTLGYPVVAVSALHDPSALAAWLTGQRSVMIGQSGMGKSTLINALAPNAAAATGSISTALRSGRHTTSATTLYRLGAQGSGESGWVIDSPGMTLFGLAHYGAAALEHAFVDLREFSGTCRFRDCRHDREPGCAVQAAILAGRVAAQRVALLRTLVDESAAAERAVRRR
ncbi:MAG: ribosome small subunit-dependent GTPase A [Proteobacteria bacterium]|nr:ribosome small subunit-dependent GTPase A [Pseudomonadota bacterium]